jgi:hypothetical protein
LTLPVRNGVPGTTGSSVESYTSSCFPSDLWT